MDVHEKVNFAAALFRNDRDLSKRASADSVPSTLVKLYDEAYELNNWLCRSGNLDSRTLWVIAKMAEIIDRLQAIEAKLQDDGEPTIGMAAPNTPAETLDAKPEPPTVDTISNRPDGRTREARVARAALKASMAGAP